MICDVCDFHENYGIQGGTIRVEHHSHFECFDCQFYNNFAIRAGVALISHEGYMIIDKGIIHHNFAVANAITDIIDSVEKYSVVQNSEIYNNYIIHPEEFEH